MRLLTRKIYRAFPELDRFSDDQCQRFINATRRGVSFYLRWGISLGSGALLLIGLLVIGLLSTRQNHGFAWLQNGRAAQSYFFGTCMTLGTLAGPMSVILIRDWLLRRRVRYILRARGTCVGCGYGLIGLPVSVKNEITCPECELLCEVDPSLGELSASNGSGTFQPNPTHAHNGWWTPKRTARLNLMWRISLRVLLVGVPLGWGAYEVFLLLQAKQASAEKPNAAGLLAIVESRQPVPVDTFSRNDPDGWFMLESAFLKRQELEILHSPSPMPLVNSKPVYLEYSLIEIEDNSQFTEPDAEYQRACRDASLSIMEHLENGGLFTQLDALAKYQRAVRPIQLVGSTPSVYIMIPSLGQSRQLSRINLARMHLATKSRDEGRFLAACESNLAIAKFIGYQPFSIDVIVALSIEIVTLNRLIMALSASPSPAFVARAKALLQRQRVTHVPGYPWDGEHAVVFDTVCWVFSDTSYTRFGRFSPALMKFTQGTLEGKLGTFTGNKDELERNFSDISQYASVPKTSRGAMPSSLQGTSDYLLVSYMQSSVSKMINVLDEIQLLRGGADLMIALEEFRLAKGTYPAFLTELVPTYMASVPLDPWSGSMIGYKGVDASTDPFHRAFILYSVGHDGKDDGGIARNNPKPRQGQMRYNLNGISFIQPIKASDFVINFPD